MWLNRKVLVRCLHIVPNSYTPAFISEQSLVFGRPEMLNHRVARDDVKRLILEWELSAIAKDPGHFRKLVPILWKGNIQYH